MADSRPRMASDLIPEGIRLAVRDAMGGNGPYSVREIENKFRAFGFRPSAPYDPSQGGGVRRATVSEHQEGIRWNSLEACERYLGLVAEVLEDLSEGAETKKDLLRGSLFLAESPRRQHLRVRADERSSPE